jgi:hypothetical protein
MSTIDRLAQDFLAQAHRREPDLPHALAYADMPPAT